MKNNKKFRKIFQLLLGIIILIIIFLKIGVKDLISIYNQFGLEIILIALVLSIIYFALTLIINSLNLLLLLKGLKQNISYKALLKIYSNSWAISKYTLTAVADVSIVYLLNKKGINLGASSIMVIIDKLITVSVLVILSLFPLFYFFEKTNSLIILAILFILALILIMSILSEKIRNIIKKFILRKYSIHFKGFSENFKLLIKKRKKYILANYCLTIIRATLSGALVWLIFYFFKSNIQLFNTISINALTNLSALIPITTAGLGVKEGVAVFLYSNFGIIASIVLMTYIIIRLAVYSLTFLIYLTYSLKIFRK